MCHTHVCSMKTASNRRVCDVISLSNLHALMHLSLIHWILCATP